MGVLAALSGPRRDIRVGTVSAVVAGVATVTVGDGSVDAQIPTTPAFVLIVGATVFVIPVGDGGTWLVIASL